MKGKKNKVSHLLNMKKIIEFILSLSLLAFVFYFLLYILMDFPHPQWMQEGVDEVKTQLK